MNISIHSLTRRLTKKNIDHADNRSISIHSLTRRLTANSFTLSDMVVFQFTASQGGWLFSAWREEIFSLHFNSQPHKEADACRNCDITGEIHISIHSLTRRLTRERFDELNPDKHFNSQPHKEADIRKILCFYRMISNFNSQPHKEADSSKSSRRITTETFQFTASQGGWRLADFSITK